MSRDSGGPAFPLPILGEWGRANSNPGMSLRDWFAGQFAPVMLIDQDQRFALADMSKEQGIGMGRLIAETAYALADDMLAERSK